MPVIKACIFDIGGVVLQSPLNAIKACERQNGLPDSYLSVLIEGPGQSGAFQRLERGELSVPEFNKLFHQELNDVESGNKYYREYCQRRRKSCPELPRKLQVDAAKLHLAMTSHALAINQDYVEAIGRLKNAGYKTVALTNNHKDEDARANKNMQRVRALFDHFIESSVVGLRKPDPRFYEYALNTAGCQPHEATFLDDLGPNLKTARQLGIHTIHVKLGRESDALIELGKLLDLPLVEPPAAKL